MSEKTVSAVIITLNEESNLRNCLESVRWADEIIVVDSGSSDKTVEIALQHTPRVFRKNWEGYSEQRNFGLSQAHHEWALFIDADERISETLASEIQETLEANESCEGYYLPRQSFYLGRWIHYGEWNPDFQLRLVQKNSAKWTGEVHERIILNGKSGYLTHPLYHYTYQNIRHHIAKFTCYSRLFAQEAFKKGERTIFSNLVSQPVSRFFNGYFARQGFRDGIPGFVIALMQAFEVLLRHVHLWRLARVSK